MVIWGMNFVVLKWAGNALPPMLFNGLRFGAAALMLGLVFKARGISLVLPRREWPTLIWLGFLGNALYQFVYINALHMTSVANSVLIITTAPVWVVLFNAWRGHERLHRRIALGVLVALFGVGIVITSGKPLEIGGTTLVGDLLSLLGALIFASSTLQSRLPFKRNPTAALAFWGVFWGATFQLFFSIPDLINLNVPLLTVPVILALGYSGLLSIGVGMIIWNHAIKTLGTRRPVVYMYLEPVVAGIGAVIFLNEPLTPYLLVGAAFVLVGVVLVQSV
jgi:drug/metabolite transporter (DMT)-like permease